MRSSTIVSTASMVSTALAMGSAQVVNQCSYDVHLSNVPAAGGGYSEIDDVLSAGGGSYSQEYTELDNGMGWAIKFAKTANYQSNVLQYEYTTHEDGTIWYDLSAVNGDPFEGNWMITANGAGCTPRQAAYRHPTDDVYGMQDCPDSADITVTICPDGVDDSSDGGSASSASPSETASATVSDDLPAYTPAATPSVTEQATEEPTEEATTAAATTTAQDSEYTNSWGGGNWDVNKAGLVEVPAASPTTLVTSVASVDSSEGYATTVMNVETQTVDAYVTETAVVKRHGHVRHPHARRAD